MAGACPGRAACAADLDCFSDMHELPVLELISATHIIADLAIEGASVAHDDLASTHLRSSGW